MWKKCCFAGANIETTPKCQWNHHIHLNRWIYQIQTEGVSLTIWMPVKLCVCVFFRSSFCCSSSSAWVIRKLFKHTHTHSLFMALLIRVIWPLINSNCEIRKLILLIFRSSFLTQTHRRSGWFRLDISFYDKPSTLITIYPMCDLSILYAKSINVILYTIN